MHNDLMLFYSFLFLSIITILTKTQSIHGQETVTYVKRGDVAELCDNRSTLVYAYDYRSLDGKKSHIIEPSKTERFSNPYRTSLLRIINVNEADSGLYKCPQDDIEWQKLQVYIPIKHIHLSNLRTSSRILDDDVCGVDNQNCLIMVEGESLDVACASDGYPRPAVDISLDKNDSTATIMALASGIQPPSLIENQFKPTVYEVYRIPRLTAQDHGLNLTCHVDMKHIDKTLHLSKTKQIYIEFRPTVVEKAKKIFAGINRTRTINCTVSRANPMYLHYTINGLPSSIITTPYGVQHGSYYMFDIMPTSIEHFRPFNVTVNNSIGYDTCTYELFHGDIPDPITHCTVDNTTSNSTVTISCTKSYAQGDIEQYACTLHIENKTKSEKLISEVARSKSCIFALETFHEPAVFRVGAVNRHGSVPLNTYGYVIPLNQPQIQKETSVFNKKISIFLICIFGGALLLLLLCCVCGTCNPEQSKLSNGSNHYQKDRYPRSSTESEALKPATDDAMVRLVLNGGNKLHHQNGAVYDIPIHLNGIYSHQKSSPTSVYHQQKSQQSANLHYIDQDSITSSLNSLRTRARTFNNKFYGNPLLENKYGPLSSTIQGNSNNDEIIENEEEDDSPVYSTTTDVMSESGSFLVSNSSTKRRAPPPPKPRYSTLSSLRLPTDNSDKVPLPCPKPRSRSNSRTRLNNGSSDNSSYLYEERPISSSDSGIGQSDVVCLPNGDTIRTGLVKSRQNSLQKHYGNPPFYQQQIKAEILTSPVVRGTEC